ncbi:MAG: hypothetical protein ACRDDZ_01410 [Marinifilaceae bacterium]
MDLIKQKDVLPSVCAKQVMIKSQFPSFELFLQGMNPDMCFNRYRSYNTVERCQQDKIVKLWEIGKIYGNKTPPLLIEVWLHKLNDYINVKEDRKLDEYQIMDIAQMLYDRFFDFNLADFALLFRKIKMGDYSQLYGSISGMNIGQWFSKYAEEKRYSIMKIEEQRRFQQSITTKTRSEKIMVGLLERFPDMKKDMAAAKARMEAIKYKPKSKQSPSR